MVTGLRTDLKEATLLVLGYAAYRTIKAPARSTERAGAQSNAWPDKARILRT